MFVLQDFFKSFQLYTHLDLWLRENNVDVRNVLVNMMLIFSEIIHIYHITYGPQKVLEKAEQLHFSLNNKSTLCILDQHVSN